MSFLNAEWRKLAIANYVVDDSVLQKHVPFGTELDQWDNKNYVSLVGFMFLNTKVLGLKIPFHINFEEVNLRFYVRHKYKGEWRRGVVFIKEIVPKYAITFVANNLYGEHYHTMKMKHQWEDRQDSRHVKYDWLCKQKWQSFGVQADLQSKPMIPGSEEEFITEHFWGYTKINKNKTTEYEVSHPSWEVYPVHSYDIQVDYGLVYGNEFSFLNHLEPNSVMLAEGSKIAVENKRKI